MIKSIGIAATAVIALATTACSDNEAPEADAVTETRMNEVDVIDGTISDEMVDVDSIEDADATGSDIEEETAETEDE